MTELDKYLFMFLGAAYFLAQPCVLLFCIWKERTEYVSPPSK